jgi:hypothetical protein
MAKKTQTRSRVTQQAAEELKAIAQGPALLPIRCTTRRVAKKARPTAVDAGLRHLLVALASGSSRSSSS